MTLIIQKPTGAKLVLAKGQPVPNDPNFAFNSLLLHGDGTNGSTVITDSSGSPKTVTAVGNAQISTAQSKFGGASIAFDGTGDRLTAVANAAFAFGTGDFTVELWFYSTSSSKQVFVDTITPGAAGNLAGRFVFFKESTNTIKFYLNGNAQDYATSTTYTTSTWSHIAITRASNTIRMFIDGVQRYSGTHADNLTLNNMRVGEDGAGAGGSGLNGYIDDLRITKDVARYTANFTPPTAPFPDF
jgi:hypothetical protein